MIAEAGFSLKQVQHFEALAKHPEVVQHAKAEARANGDVVSRTAVLQAISEAKKPFISNNSGDSEWYTPQCYIEAARRVMGSIDLDPASLEVANRTVQANEYFTADQNGLLSAWKGNIWLNPPYSDVSKFVQKLCDSELVTQAIVLVNNATETGWFERIVEKATAIVFHRGRLKFIKPGHELSAPMQGQAFIYIGSNPEIFLSEFQQFGWGTLLTKKK